MEVARIARPSDINEVRAVLGWLTYSIPRWVRAGYTLPQMVEATSVWNTPEGKADVMRRYMAGDFAGVGYPPLPEEKPPVEPPPEQKPGVPPYVSPEISRGIDQKLDAFEEQVEGLEQHFESLNATDPKAVGRFGVLAEAARKLLSRLEGEKTRQVAMMGAVTYPHQYPNWSISQKLRLENLIGRLASLIVKCRTEGAKKPAPWPQLPTDILQDWPESEFGGLAGFPGEWRTELSTELIRRSQEKGVPLYADIDGLTAAEKVRAMVEGATVPITVGAAPTPEPWWRKNLPYIIIGGLGISIVAATAKAKKRVKK